MFSSSYVKNSVNYVRSSWLEIFQKENYLLIEPSSLIPKDDPSLLWINSGVAALKKYFNDPDLSPSKNLVNCQRVIRTNDLDRIDANSYHQTLFEMLGCFSIGGNFKEEVIPLIWNYFTDVEYLGIDPNKLFITVLDSDTETYNIWKKQSNVNVENIIMAPRSSNFWDMGDGPCGPNTEIYYCFNDFGIKKPLSVEDLESKNFIEIINIVFSEFYHKADEYLPLSKKCVDVGGGLERIALVLQDVQNTFQVDIWKRPIEWLEICCKKNNVILNNDNKWNLYVIADHLRTSIFAISDGALPDHKMHGYVLKKLLKRSSLLSYILGISVEDLLILYKNIIFTNSEFYKELVIKEEQIRKVLEKELIKLFSIFEKSVEKIKRYLEESVEQKISSEKIFFWYDTEGISLELIDFSLRGSSNFFDREDFYKLLKIQKERSLLERKKHKISTFNE